MTAAVWPWSKACKGRWTGRDRPVWPWAKIDKIELVITKQNKTDIDRAPGGCRSLAGLARAVGVDLVGRLQEAQEKARCWFRQLDITPERVRRDCGHATFLVPAGFYRN